MPIVVNILPACKKRPDLIADEAKAGLPEPVRGGAQLQRFRDGHIRLWTGRVSILIDAPADQSLTDQIVRELRAMNRMNTARSGDQLPAPDLSGCPPVEVPPLRNLPGGR